MVALSAIWLSSHCYGRETWLVRKEYEHQAQVYKNAIQVTDVTEKNVPGNERWHRGCFSCMKAPNCLFVTCLTSETSTSIGPSGLSLLINLCSSSIFLDLTCTALFYFYSFLSCFLPLPRLSLASFYPTVVDVEGMVACDHAEWRTHTRWDTHGRGIGPS